MFLRNCWYVAAWSFDLAADQLLPMSIIAEPIVLFRRGDGTPVALQDRCCHRRARLSRGRLEGDCVRCMYHGLKFDSAGRCVEIPGQDMIPPQAFVHTLPVVERGSWLWVWMGDAEKADPALIPGTVALDDPGWDLRTGQMDYKANYIPPHSGRRRPSLPCGPKSKGSTAACGFRVGCGVPARTRMSPAPRAAPRRRR
jgi:phenylpropionate dioxygenase-like ring-hydroxylating dioxygenase large terminal subunit